MPEGISRPNGTSSVSFMAKFDEKGAGSSSHIHISLWNGAENVFNGDLKEGPLEVSDTFRWFLGGWIKFVPDMMPFYAPTINSYKRFVDESWAPTRLAWSLDNRTAGFRVVGNGPGLRIECRIPGADCNPYLTYAAALASGLKGIEDKIEPPECFTGDIYSATNLPRVPYSLEEASPGISKQRFCQKCLRDDDVIKHYTHFFNKEIEDFRTSVTDWERKRYFERI